MTLELNGLTDELIRSIILDLPQEVNNAEGLTYDQEMQKLRNTLALFVASHPQAEKVVARLLLKHVGFSQTILRQVMYERHATTSSSSSLNSLNFSDDEFILPALSPVPWLSNASWSAMSELEKMEFMNCACFEAGPSGSALSTLPPPCLLGEIPDVNQVLSSSTTCAFRDRVVLGNGPRHVLVLVGIHGNEGCGVRAVGQILSRFRLFHGSSDASNSDLHNDKLWDIQPLSALFDKLTMEFVLGNPQAYQKSTRFVKKNLNRLFDERLLCDDERARLEGYQYELQRARVINESIRHADFVLDVHSCSADVGSFALPSSLDIAEEIAQQLPVKYVIQSLAHMTLEGGTTMDASLLYNIPGVCVECGKHDHPDIVARASAIISSCLRHQCFDSTKDKDCGAASTLFDDSKPLVMKCITAERVHEGFEWIHKFPEFHHVPFDTAVFRDAIRGEVRCPYSDGAHIVMPTEIPVQGEEALFWAIAAN